MCAQTINVNHLFQVKNKPAPEAPAPALDPDDPFNDDQRDTLQMEAMAKKFENKYVGCFNFLHECCFNVTVF